MRGLQKIAFICGCGHSGTTLVATILASHPRIYLPLNESGAFLGNEEEALRYLQHLKSSAIHAGKDVLVEKTPFHVRTTDTIRRLVPGSGFIFLVRDGRDVTASIAHRYNGDFTLGLERWVSDNTIVLNERHRADSHLIRYEDIIADPPQQIRRLCGFLGVCYSDDLLEYHKQPRLWYGRKEIRRISGGGGEHEDLRNWQVNQPIFDGRGRWMRDLPAAVVKRFRSGEPLRLMKAFGYIQEPWWRRVIG